jgi:hypothetical protein
LNFIQLVDDVCKAILSGQKSLKDVQQFINNQISEIKQEVVKKSYGTDPETIKKRKLELKQCLRQFTSLLFCTKINLLIEDKTKQLESLGPL